jgi:xanthine dehydrogenase YagS FAD-binding subunit
MHQFGYLRAKDAKSAIAGATTAETVRYLAGGTTLYDLMKLNLETPTKVVDINRLGLNQIEVGEAGVVLGALARMSDVADHQLVATLYPAISESLWKAASQQLRNMASLGGNLLQRTRCAYFRGGEPYPCNKREAGSGCAALRGQNRNHALFGGSENCIATYPGDFAISLIAFDATVDVDGPEGRRSIPISKLHLEPGDTPSREHSLRHGELITRIRIPATAAGRASTYHKVRDRESYAFALVSAAAALQIKDDVVTEARLGLGGVATKPWRAKEAETFLIGKNLSEAIAREAGDLAFSDARVTDQNKFKKELGARVVADALMIAKGRL